MELVTKPKCKRSRPAIFIEITSKRLWLHEVLAKQATERKSSIAEEAYDILAAYFIKKADPDVLLKIKQSFTAKKVSQRSLRNMLRW